MTIKVGIVDYGMGNLHSVSNAIATAGAKVVVSNKISQLKKSRLLVVPGVGAFGAAMKTLRRKKLDKFIKDWIENDKPYLGICLGFQILFERSQENPGVNGLGTFQGSVIKFKKSDLKKGFDQIPHMGWNTVEKLQNRNNSYFNGINSKNSFYFVHTYYPVPKDKNIVYTKTKYGKSFCSSVVKDNLFASQFHPEKSGEVGQALIKNVLNRAWSQK